MSGRIFDSFQLLKRLEQGYAALNARDSDIYSRIDNLTRILDRTGIFREHSRMDYRLTRLEILEYYRDQQRRSALDNEALQLLEELE